MDPSDSPGQPLIKDILWENAAPVVVRTGQGAAFSPSRFKCVVSNVTQDHMLTVVENTSEKTMKSLCFSLQHVRHHATTGKPQQMTYKYRVLYIYLEIAFLAYASEKPSELVLFII